MSDSEASIESDVPLAPLSNLKIELVRTAEVNADGEIYAKVIGDMEDLSNQTRIRFTSVSPDMKSGCNASFDIDP